MEKKINWKKDLFLLSLIITAAFALILLLTQYFVFMHLAAEKEVNKARSKISSEEMSLYQANTKNISDLFLKEIESVENESSSVSAKVAKNYIGSRIRPVQAYFDEYKRKRPGFRNIFLLNKQGRLLAFTPYNEELHNNVYDYAQYYKFLKIQFASSKKNSATYFYLLDPEVINRGITNSLIAQPPFYGVNEAASMGRGVLENKLLDLPTSAEFDTSRKIPYLITASPYFTEDGYFGMSGFTVPLSYYVDRVRENMPNDLMKFLILTDDGYVMYSPDTAAIGTLASGDSLVKQVMLSIKKKKKDSSFVFHNAGPVFYSKSGRYVFIAFPVKYAEGLKHVSFLKTKLSPLVYLLLLFELLLIAIVFLLYHRKIILGLQGIISRHTGDLLLPPFADELEKIEYIIGSQPDTVGDLLSTPAVVETPSDPFTARIANKGLSDKVNLAGPNILDIASSAQGSAVYLSLHNTSAFLAEANAGMQTLNDVAPLIYRLAERYDGFITNSSMTAFTVCFGIPFLDPDHMAKSWQFIKAVLSEFPASANGRTAVGCAAETGTLIYGGLRYNGQEEFVVTGPVMDQLQKIESIAGDNVAIVGESYFKNNVVDKGLIKEEITLKIRDKAENVLMYVVKI